MTDPMQCVCLGWARGGQEDELLEPWGKSHHPRCRHFRARVFLQLTANGNTCTMEPHEAAEALAESDDQSEYTVTAVRMSQERFESLPEFEGF